MNIAIIGAGNVGGTLGTRWAKGSHQVTFGVRKPQDAKIKKVLDAAGQNARAAGIAEAVKEAGVVVLTTPWEGSREAITSAGSLVGKILIDATNPILLGEEGLKKGLVVGFNTSAAEQLASWVPGASVVKAFNTTGAGNMANPQYGPDKATMFICGDSAEAKSTVQKLSDELGFETVDSGPLSMARYLEPMAMFWISMAFAQGMGMNFALKMVKR
ncbi:MAG: oxidoreductase coenzyme F420-dependent [Pedosphaera sp.]|nr:oxidoreductase coenzyme F420-dependent [Pedosphaera sp.]